jgi:hypothetical protein
MKDEISGFMEYLGLDSKMCELKVMEIWNECVGETIAKYSTPVEIRRNKLLVVVQNSVWRYELSMKRKEIIDALNSYLVKIDNKKLIKEIVFV